MAKAGIDLKNFVTHAVKPPFINGLVSNPAHTCGRCARRRELCRLRNEIAAAEFECAKHRRGFQDGTIGGCDIGSAVGGRFAGARERANRKTQLLRTLRLLSGPWWRPDRGASDLAVRHARARHRSKNPPNRHRDHQRPWPIRETPRARPFAKRGTGARNGQPRCDFRRSRSAMTAVWMGLTTRR
jgi:hypothetical protein